MNLADLSIRRPTFITCVVLLMLAIGLISMKRLGVDLFPDVTFPVVTVTTPYRGAGPAEIETLVSRPLEDEISTLSGLKRLSSVNQEGVSQLIAEFTLETDVKYAEQQIRDRVGAAKRLLPSDVDEPVIRRLDPSDLPVIQISISADLKPGELFDLANEFIRPRLEQVNQVGLVEVIGGRKREIHVKLDRERLSAREISATQVAQRLAAAGENIPVGKIDRSGTETVYRTLGQFTSLKDISSTIVSFLGNDIPTSVADVATVEDALSDEKSRVFVNGKPSLLIQAFRQSGSNTIAVVDGLRKRVEQINLELKSRPGAPRMEIIRDNSVWIRANVADVEESILIGVVLAVVVVFLFLGSARSTIITGLALPNSLIGAFILMALAGFTINVMTLLALSLSVGLLIDDAIVVRENIYRHIENGEDPVTAASRGTAEVRLAVIATTLAVVAVFGPVAFLKGVLGQFMRSFGLTVCFAMMISLFDALTIAPMLSAYFAGKAHALQTSQGPMARVLQAFDRFQTWLENKYEALIRTSLQRPLRTIGIAVGVFVICVMSAGFIPSTFLPAQDQGEFVVALDMPPGTSLDRMSELTARVDEKLRANPEVRITNAIVGGRNGESNIAEIYIGMLPFKQRKMSTLAFKDLVREQLKEFQSANPLVKDYDPVGSGQRPFALNIAGTDQMALEAYASKVASWLRKDPTLIGVDTNFRAGKPELQVVPNKARLEALGISSVTLGQELRAQIEGVTPAKFRQAGLEYDVRVRLKEDQRNLDEGFNRTKVPNINYSLVRLNDVARPVLTTGPTKIYRQNRMRYVQINADVSPKGDLGGLIAQMKRRFAGDPELKLPEGMSWAVVGQTENFQEMASGMPIAMGFGVLFIFLVLASLYESFVTPLTIMIALPLAFAGSFLALLISGQSMNIFSMIGMVMLLGVASKNSILLVDFANQLVDQGKSRTEAVLIAGRTRLRPILMTTMALIAGSIPIALGLNEASRQRVSMGYAIIGGLISSTVLTLVIVPAAYIYIDRFRVWSRTRMKRLFGVTEGGAEFRLPPSESMPH